MLQGQFFLTFWFVLSCLGLLAYAQKQGKKENVDESGSCGKTLILEAYFTML